MHEQVWMLLCGYKELELVDAEFVYIVFRLLMDPSNLSSEDTGENARELHSQYKETFESNELNEVNNPEPAANQKPAESNAIAIYTSDYVSKDLEMEAWSYKELVQQFRRISENRIAYTKIGYLKGEKREEKR